MMRELIAEYSTLKSVDEKRAYLDRILDDVERLRAIRQGNGMSAEEIKRRREKRKRRTLSLSWIKKRIESPDSKERAGLIGFLMDLRARRKERGMKPFKPWKKCRYREVLLFFLLKYGSAIFN